VIKEVWYIVKSDYKSAVQKTGLQIRTIGDQEFFNLKDEKDFEVQFID